MKRLKFNPLVPAIAILICLTIPFGPAAASEGVMMQFFHWYYPGGGILWQEVASRAEDLAAAGITALWLPPAYKGREIEPVDTGAF